MGGACCKVEALPKPKCSVAAAQVAGVFPGLQSFTEYALRYQEIQLVTTTTTTTRGMCTEIRAIDSGLLYICRRVPYKEAPLCHDPERLRDHVETLCELDHPHLCKLVEVFSDPESGDCLLISERADQPTLLDYIDEHGLPNGDIDAADCVRQILSGLAHGHERGVVHGRLRHDCLLLAHKDGGGGKASPTSKERESKHGEDALHSPKGGGPPQMKICDMGLGYALREPIGSKCANYEGLLYVPPENAWAEKDRPQPPERENTGESDEKEKDSEEASHSLEGSSNASPPMLLALEHRPPEGLPGHWSETKRGAAPPGSDKIDVWAVGVLTFNLLSGLLPFEASDEEKLMEHLRCHKPKFTKEPWGEISSKAYNAVDMMLKLTPAMRPTAMDMLRHPWLRVTRLKVAKPRIFNLFRNAICNLYEGQFKKLVCRIITKQLSQSHKHKDEAMEVFRALDKDRDGLLSFEEFEAALKKVPDLEKYLVDPAMLFEAIDRNGSGALDAHEFTAATLPPAEARDEKNLWYAFRAFDTNESGSITLDEVVTSVRLLEGMLLAPGQVQELCAAIRLELEALGFGPNLLVTLGLHDHDDESAFARGAERCMSIMPFAHRRLDFGEFVYLCKLRQTDFVLPHWSKKEAYRCVDICCDVDMYHQAHRSHQLPWPPPEGASARTPESAYERKGLSGDANRRRESRKKTSHRFGGRHAAHAAGQHHSPRGSVAHSPRSQAARISARVERFKPTHHGHHWHEGHHHADGEHHEHHEHKDGEHHHHHHHHHSHHGGKPHNEGDESFRGHSGRESGRPGESGRAAKESGRGSQSARGTSGRQTSSRTPSTAQKTPASSAYPSGQKAAVKKPKRRSSDHDSEPDSDDEEEEEEESE